MTETPLLTRMARDPWGSLRRGGGGVPADRFDRHRRAKAIGGARELGSDEEAGDSGVVELEVELRGGQAPVEREEDRAEAQAREHGDDRGRMVGSEVGDPVTANWYAYGRWYPGISFHSLRACFVILCTLISPA